MKSTKRKLLPILAAAALMFFYGAAEAHASWGSFGSRGGSWGGGSRGFGSGGGSWGGGSRGGSLLGGSRGGPVRNLLGRIRANHSNGGGSLGLGSRGGSLGSRGGSFGSRGGSFGSRGGSRGGSWGGGSMGSRGSYYSSSNGGGSTGFSGISTSEAASADTVPRFTVRRLPIRLLRIQSRFNRRQFTTKVFHSRRSMLLPGFQHHRWTEFH